MIAMKKPVPCSTVKWCLGIVMANILLTAIITIPLVLKNHKGSSTTETAASAEDRNASSISNHSASLGKPTAFAGDGFSGVTLDVELATLVNDAWTSLQPNPRSFGFAVVYDEINNALHEGSQWMTGYWTFNSYGIATALFPFANAAFTSWISNAQDFWFKNRGDGVSAPRGILGDGCTPTACGYRQGDGQTWRHDYIIEGSLAGAIVKTNQLLAERNQTAIDFYAEIIFDTASFAEGRRDVATQLLLGGPSSNLVAPSYIGWVVGSQWLWGHPSGITITSIALNLRMAALFRLTTAYLEESHPKHNWTTSAVTALVSWALTSRQTLTQILALDPHHGYFVKSLDGDGTRHGDLSQSVHAYIDSTVNLDALLYHREVLPKDRQIPSPIMTTAWSSIDLQESIMNMMLNTTNGLRELDTGFMRVNAPSLDDMEEEPFGFWEFGVWVNGGIWLTNEGRLLLSYARLNRMAEWKTSVSSYLTVAHRFNTDPQSLQPGMSTDLDSFSVPAAAVRAFFEYHYDDVGLELTPQPPLKTMLELNQLFPIKLGRYRIYIQTRGECCDIHEARINNQSWAFVMNNASVLIPFSALKAFSSRVLLLSIQFSPVTEANSTTTPFLDSTISICNTSQLLPSNATLSPECRFPEQDVKAQRWITFLNALCASTMQTDELIWSAEAEHARILLKQIAAQRLRCQGLLEGTISPPTDTLTTTQVSATYASLPMQLEIGLVKTLSNFRFATNNSTQQLLYNAFVSNT